LELSETLIHGKRRKNEEKTARALVKQLQQDHSLDEDYTNWEGPADEG
jgi:hypothetical protein